MKKNIAGLFLLGLIVSSCNDFQRKNQLHSIETMNKSLDSMYHVLQENRIDTLSGIIIAINRIEIRIKENYHSQIIDLTFAKRMNRFREIKHAFEAESEEGESGEREKETLLGASYVRINKGIQEEKEMLKKLHTDIDQGNGIRSKYDEYVAFEQGKVNQIKTLLTFYVKQKREVLGEFYPLYDSLDAFATKLANESTNKK